MDAGTSPQIVVNRPNGLQEADCGEGLDSHADDHLMTLKALTEKLRLETRRPSYLEWKARLETESFKKPGTGKYQFQEEPEGEPAAHRETTEQIQPTLSSSDVLKGFDSIDEALSWLRKELVRHISRFFLPSFSFTYLFCSTFRTQTRKPSRYLANYNKASTVQLMGRGTLLMSDSVTDWESDNRGFCKCNHLYSAQLLSRGSWAWSPQRGPDRGRLWATMGKHFPLRPQMIVIFRAETWTKGVPLLVFLPGSCHTRRRAS